MRKLWLILFCFTLILSCNSNKNSPSNISSLIPDNTSIILKTNSLEGLRSGIKNNALIQEALKYPQVETLELQLENLKHLKTTNEILICLAIDKSDSLEFSVITKFNKDLFILDSVPNHTTKTIASKTNSIIETRIDTHTLYSTITDSLFFLSNKQSLVEASLRKKLIDPELEKIYNTADENKTLSVIINLKNENFAPLFFNDSLLNTRQFSNYLLVDTDVSENNLFFNGITKATDSTHSLINVFKGSIPQENKTSQIIPADTDYFMSFTFNNFKTFQEQLQRSKKTDTVVLATNLFDNIVEVGVVSNLTNRAIVLRSIDAVSTQEAIESQIISDTFRSIAIYSISNTEHLQQTLSPFINTIASSHYINIGDFFVFSDTVDFLKTIISNHQNNTVLSESNQFQDLMLNLSDESSLFIYANASNLNTILDTNFSVSKNLNIERYKASAIQFIYDTDFAHVNGVIKTYKTKAASNSVSETQNITLDADLLSAPQLVTNHTNNQKDILVQDINNTLYLISNQGKVFWKKQLNGKILGDVEQIDIYKNGRLQLVFATPKRVYVLDRKGNDVASFPLKFNDEITQPLSVFDYDKKKSYRLLVTQDKSLLMYDQKGKTVNGFTYKKAANTISSQPKHFRIGRKDYIVFSQGNTLEILNRVGKTRIDIKESISFSNNAIYLFNNDFTTTNINGQLVRVTTKGQLSTTNLNLADKHAIVTTSKTFVSLSENKLTIKSKTIELEFGDYTSPEIFYINDKIYVTTTDLQSKKVYLFDSQAKLIANFPIFGNSSMVLDNLDKDRNLEMVVQGEHNSIIIYEIN